MTDEDFPDDDNFRKQASGEGEAAFEDKVWKAATAPMPEKGPEK